MGTTLVRVMGLWIAAGALVAAADFWTAKPFMDWSDKEAQSMMQSSPWAAVVSAPLPPTMPMPTVDGAGGRGGGRGGDDGFGPGPRRIRVTISWRSALPLKQALVRTQAGLRGTPTAENSTFLSQEEQFYVIGLTGLPPQYVRPGTGATIAAFLERKGRTPIPAEQAGTQQGAGGPTLLIAFPRSDAIALEDGEVEVTAKFDGLEVKKKFKLKDMVFEGSLAL